MSEPEKNGGRHLTSAERQELYRERAEHRRRAELSEKEKKRRRMIIIAAVAVVVVIAAAIGLSMLISRVIIPENRYNKALSLFEAGEYAKAMDAFDGMGDYRDSRDYVKRCILEQARALAGRDDVVTGTTADMPWFSFDTGDETGILKFDAETYRGEGNVVIPDVFDGVLVRGIAARAFYRCDFLTSVSLPPSVRVIRERAFYGCEKLASVELPAALTDIGEYAFGKCTALASVSFGGGSVRIGQRAFDGCTALGVLTLPEGIGFIGYRAFGGCTGLTEVSLPASLETVEAQAFVGCESVKTLRYPGSRASLEAVLGEGGKPLLSAAEIITGEN